MSKSAVFFLGRRYFASGSSSRLASFISILAMTGLVMGVAMLIIVLSVMNGFDREMRTRILGVVPHVQLFQRGGVAEWQALAEVIGSVPGVAEVTPFTGFQGMINARGKVQAVTVQGLLPKSLDSAMAEVLPPETGDWLAGEAAGRSGLMLSRVLAEKLGVERDHTLTLIVPRPGEDGRQLAPLVRVFSLAGIFDTHTAEDVGLALIHLDIAGDLAGYGARPQGLRISVEDVFAARELGYHLIRQLPSDYSFIDWFQTHGNLHQAIQMSRQMVGLLIFLIIAIAVFNV
ncbi:MAG: ABC transporter permease, partial [Porticoccaceae bacterium]|nr:ABC transporter permease [Porticoccaceae bacterium]